MSHCIGISISKHLSLALWFLCLISKMARIYVGRQFSTIEEFESTLEGYENENFVEFSRSDKDENHYEQILLFLLGRQAQKI